MSRQSRSIREKLTVTDQDRSTRRHVEPSADIRIMSSFCYQLFVALKAEGFTESQALLILGQTIQGATAAND
jgi:hypothetical protein